MAEGRRVLRGHETGSLAVLPVEPGHAGEDHDPAGSQGLGGDESESLVAARDDHEVGRSVDETRVLLKTKPVHPVADGCRALAQGRLLRTPPGEGQPCAGNGPHDLRPRIEEEVDPLLRVEASDEAHEWPLSREAELLAGLVPGPGRLEESRCQAVRHHRRGAAAEGCDPIGDILRDGDARRVGPQQPSRRALPPARVPGRRQVPGAHHGDASRPQTMGRPGGVKQMGREHLRARLPQPAPQARNAAGIGEPESGERDARIAKSQPDLTGGAVLVPERPDTHLPPISRAQREALDHPLGSGEAGLGHQEVQSRPLRCAHVPIMTETRLVNSAPTGDAEISPAQFPGLQAQGSPMTDQDLIAHWKERPFPLLPLLHAFHDRDGQLTDDALRAISEGLRIPLAELFGAVDFYHHLSRTPGGRDAPRVCTGPVCRQRGADDLLAALADQGATEMPCAGRCDDPIPVLVGRESRRGSADGTLEAVPSPLPPAAPEGAQECVFGGIREPGRATLAGYRATGGYEALAKVVASDPAAVRQELLESGLAGRGGAAFPTAVKWTAVAEAEGEPKSIVCNADEGEPGCFKDRALMDHDPHALIEGMAIAARCTGATRGIIYLRYEYPETEAILERALAEAREAGLIGGDFAGSGQDFDLYVRVGAGSYVCGEETALLESLEGNRPFPRNRPPYPVTHGLEGKPTAVNNVETLCAVAPIIRNGAAWYQGLGAGEHAGTKVVSVSGDVQRPGNYEIPIGMPLRTLLDEWAGGAQPGRTLVAATMAGLSGGFLTGEDLETTLDEPALRARGSFLGAGGIMVLDDTRELRGFTKEAMHFFADESCGKCFPCRIGTQRLHERLAGTAGPKDAAAWREEVQTIGHVMKTTSACGLGVAAPLVVDSLLRAEDRDAGRSPAEEAAS